VHVAIPQESPVIELGVTSAFTNPFENNADLPNRLERERRFFDRCYEAAGGIRTIDPDEKENSEVLRATKKAVSESQVIYILGFGFDENNSRRIGLSDLGHPPQKSIMFTNFEDIETVNKRASKLFFNRYNNFSVQRLWGDPSANYMIEKSNRNVYDALEKDFFSLEDSLLGSIRI
jgi:hypothetical protein